MELVGTWDVERVSGFLPPLLGMRKRIGPLVDGVGSGETTLGPVRAPFDVVGTELRYRAPFDGFVDVLEPEGGSWSGRALLRGHEYGRFRLKPVAEARPSSLDEQLVQHIDEAISMEESVRRLLEGMIATTDDPQVIDLLEHHKVETERHSQRLRARLEARGAKPSLMREATGVLGALAKLPLDFVRGEKAGRNARDAFAAEHMEIAAYQLLERVATRAGDEETAEVARQNRAEEEAMARRLDEHWDTFADLSLREERVTG
ncbi:MAG TPA: DUF892 family protein [Gaiellaceae bacterium]|nr:DUF892 family protein [Gaiellaceae bacterium]